MKYENIYVYLCVFCIVLCKRGWISKTDRHPTFSSWCFDCLWWGCGGWAFERPCRPESQGQWLMLLHPCSVQPIIWRRQNRNLSKHRCQVISESWGHLSSYHGQFLRLFPAVLSMQYLICTALLHSFAHFACVLPVHQQYWVVLAPGSICYIANIRLYKKI